MIDCAFHGSVVRDAEAKISKSGKPYARFTVRDGEGDAALFVSVMYFGGDCADLAAKATKGTGIYVEGRLSLDRWEKDGEQRTGLSVMSGHCRVAAIGRNKPERREPTPDKSKPIGEHLDDEIPF
jgi:single-strand DNA-binding protein